MGKPVVRFDSWNIQPCLPCGELITDYNIKRWDGVTHIFAEDWQLELWFDGEYYLFKIKSGFITDGGSIPRIARNIINPWGKFAPGFFVHDGLYSTHLFTQKEADIILRAIMDALNDGWYIQSRVYFSLYMFGHYAYNSKTADYIKKNLRLFKIEEQNVYNK